MDVPVHVLASPGGDPALIRTVQKNLLGDSHGRLLQGTHRAAVDRIILVLVNAVDWGNLGISDGCG
jgi:hypothetical protein